MVSSRADCNEHLNEYITLHTNPQTTSILRMHVKYFRFVVVLRLHGFSLNFLFLLHAKHVPNVLRS